MARKVTKTQKTHLSAEKCFDAKNGFRIKELGFSGKLQNGGEWNPNTWKVLVLKDLARCGRERNSWHVEIALCGETHFFAKNRTFPICRALYAKMAQNRFQDVKIVCTLFSLCRINAPENHFLERFAQQLQETVNIFTENKQWEHVNHKKLMFLQKHVFLYKRKALGVFPTQNAKKRIFVFGAQKRTSERFCVCVLLLP